MPFSVEPTKPKRDAAGQVVKDAKGRTVAEPDTRWKARYRKPNGRQGSQTFDRKGDAERWGSAMSADVDRNEFLDPQKRRQKFDEWGDRWLRHLESAYQENTRAVYWKLYTKHIQPAFTGRAVGTIDWADISEFLTAKLKDHSWKYVAEMRWVLVQIFEMVRKSNVRRDNPAKEHKIPRVKQRIDDDSVFTMQQVIDFVRALPKWAQAMGWVLLYAGLRPSELAGLRIRHLNFATRLLRAGTETLVDVQAYNGQRTHQAAGDGKTTAADRGIPLPQWLVDDIAADLAGRPAMYASFGIEAPPATLDDRLFLDWRDSELGRGKQLTVRGLRAIVRRALRDAGLPEDFRTYDFRHTHASLLFDLGHNPLTVGQRQGHTDPSVTLKVYGHVYNAAQEKLTESLDELREQTLREMLGREVIDLAERRHDAG